jgi:putative transposase
MEDVFKKAPHNPPHLFRPNAIYMLTASTYENKPFMATAERKTDFHNAFLEAAKIYQWTIIAWVILHDHYHAILESPENPLSLSKFINSYHKFTARRWNTQDRLYGRKVWWNYWDTCIRTQEGYLNRLRYVFWNPVKHGLVDDPATYSFSNYGDFLEQEWFHVVSAPVEVENVPEF